MVLKMATQLGGTGRNRFGHHLRPQPVLGEHVLVHRTEQSLDGSFCAIAALPHDLDQRQPADRRCRRRGGDHAELHDLAGSGGVSLSNPSSPSSPSSPGTPPPKGSSGPRLPSSYSPNGTAVKSTKSAAGERDVWIPSHVLPSLREHLLRYADPELLFPVKDDPTEHLRQSTLAKFFYKARDKAGVPTLRFHDLRHAHLTKFAQTGATTAEIMRQAGHSTSVASQRYQHAAEDRMREMTERMSKGYTARTS